MPIRFRTAALAWLALCAPAAADQFVVNSGGPSNGAVVERRAGTSGNVAVPVDESNPLPVTCTGCSGGSGGAVTNAGTFATQDNGTNTTATAAATGTTADTAWSGSGTSTIVAALKAIFNKKNTADLTTPGTTNATAASSSKHIVSSILTRIANTTTYTSATSTAPETVCLFTSVTACAPLTLTVSSTNVVSGAVTGVHLVKSTTGATGATFRVLVYQGAPTLTNPPLPANIFDTSTYTPVLADQRTSPAPAYVGSWECASQNVNSDNSGYDCTANTPIGYNQFNLTDGTLRFVVLVTGAYVPGSSETFSVTADLLLPGGF